MIKINYKSKSFKKKLLSIPIILISVIIIIFYFSIRENKENYNGLQKKIFSLKWNQISTLVNNTATYADLSNTITIDIINQDLKQVYSISKNKFDIESFIRDQNNLSSKDANKLYFAYDRVNKSNSKFDNVFKNKKFILLEDENKIVNYYPLKVDSERVINIREDYNFSYKNNDYLISNFLKNVYTGGAGNTVHLIQVGNTYVKEKISSMSELEKVFFESGNENIMDDFCFVVVNYMKSEDLAISDFKEYGLSKKYNVIALVQVYDYKDARRIMNIEDTVKTDYLIDNLKNVGEGYLVFISISRVILMTLIVAYIVCLFYLISLFED